MPDIASDPSLTSLDERRAGHWGQWHWNPGAGLFSEEKLDIQPLKTERK